MFAFKLLAELTPPHTLDFCLAHQVDSRDWALNGNTISLDDETVIDVPEPYNHAAKYCASLGHKANHSFTPNCIYDP